MSWKSWKTHTRMHHCTPGYLLIFKSNYSSIVQKFFLLYCNNCFIYYSTNSSDIEILSWTLRKYASYKVIKEESTFSLVLRMLLLLQGIEVNPGPIHAENRSKVCAMCYLKSDRLLNLEQEQLVKQYINANYLSSHDGFPLGICMSCRCHLKKKRNFF